VKESRRNQFSSSSSSSRSNRDVTSFPRNCIVGTDGQTNGPTNQRTNQPTQSLIEVLFAPKKSHLKMERRQSFRRTIFSSPRFAKKTVRVSKNANACKGDCLGRRPSEKENNQDFENWKQSLLRYPPWIAMRFGYVSVLHCNSISVSNRVRPKKSSRYISLVLVFVRRRYLENEAVR
jgi:hypothetical protein